MKATLHECPHTSIYCDTFSCTNLTVYWIGCEDGPANTKFKVCKECAENIFKNTPEQFLHHVVIPRSPVEDDVPDVPVVPDIDAATGSNETIIDPLAVTTEPIVDLDVPLNDPQTEPTFDDNAGEVVDEPKVVVELEAHSLPVLRDIAKAKELKGYSALNKDELIEVIRNAPVVSEC